MTCDTDLPCNSWAMNDVLANIADCTQREIMTWHIHQLCKKKKKNRRCTSCQQYTELHMAGVL